MEVKQSRLRRFLPAVLIPHGVAVLLVVVVAVAALMFSATSMVALPATIAQLWLALNMSAVSGSGAIIGVIPMVPGLLLVWAIARRVHRAVKKRVSIADLAVLTGLVLALPLSLAGIASAMLYDASAVLDVDIPPVSVMLGRVALLHLSGLVLGMGPRLWRALARRYGAPDWGVDAVALAIRFLLTYALLALLTVVLMMAVNYQAFTDTFTGYEEGSAIPALLVLSLLYLPNMVIFAMGIMVGAPLYFGDGSISLFSVLMVPLPPLPILTALPASAPPWAVILLIVPAAVAAWVCIKNPVRLIVTATAAVFAAIFFLVLGLLAGGQLGVYGYVGLNLLPAVGLLMAYLLVVGLLISGIDRLRATARAPRATVLAPEPVDEPPEDLAVEPDTAPDDADEAEDDPGADQVMDPAADIHDEATVYIEDPADAEEESDPAEESPGETATDPQEDTGEATGEPPEVESESTLGKTNDGSPADDR